MAIIEVKTEVAGIVWKIAAGAGDAVSEDDAVIILESMKMEIPVASMKMEIPVAAPASGTILEIPVAEGETVAEGAVVASASLPSTSLFAVTACLGAAGLFAG